MLMWPSSDPLTKILIDRLQAAGHEIVYWVGERPIEYLNPAGCIFHDHYDAWDASRAEAFRDADIAPADPILIESMYATESLLLSMMNKRYDEAPVDERKHVYYTMLSYWNHVLDTTKPDFILYALVPHSIYSNIVYDLARTRGIPTLCFEDTWAALRLLPFEDFWKGNEGLHVSLSTCVKQELTLEDIGKELRDYYLATRELREVPSYMQQQKKLAEGFGLVWHRIAVALRALRSGALPRLLSEFARRAFMSNLRGEYERLTSNVGWDVPFVYFPLSFQPERTTSPQGGIFHDQILAVETLAAALPKAWEVYVKEHPSQWWLRGKTRYSSARYKGYYERLAKIPRARLVPIHASSFELTKRSKTVATITGTAGWEALARGKMPLVFGYPWYRDCPGVFRVSSAADCIKALEKIERGAEVHEQDIIAYLKALEENSIRAHLADPPAGSPVVQPEENMRIIADFVLSHMNSLRPASQ
ncbi:hypothetical protein HY417_01115 [Candidatus Kaiserbacteria bacterium]|nr:hypothetical protein [Candidatus Kaiserbacteria bacterium]